MSHLHLVTLVVRDHDAAIRFFVDTPLGSAATGSKAALTQAGLKTRLYEVLRYTDAAGG
jgi:hypothetical protein